jgi:hypothetical protein
VIPLPGSEDHERLHRGGVAMDPDLNKYDLEHVTTGHKVMAVEAWAQVYRDAWNRYYTDAHVETVLRRAVIDGLNPKKIVDALTIFSGAARIEGVHPLQFGYVRGKRRSDRRHGMKLENPVVFYPRRAWEFAGVAASWLRLARRYRGILRQVLADPLPAGNRDRPCTGPPKTRRCPISSPPSPTRSRTPTAPAPPPDPTAACACPNTPPPAP